MKIILTLLFMTLGTICYAQTEPIDSITTQVEQTPCPEIPTDLPEFVVVYGDTVGVLVSVTQLQRMDSNEDLLALLLQMDDMSVEAEHYYINIVNNMNEKINLYSQKVTNLTEQLKTQENQLTNLKKQVANCEEQQRKTEEQRENDAIIKQTYEEDVKKLKLQRAISYSSGGFFGLVAIITTTLYILK